MAPDRLVLILGLLAAACGPAGNARECTEDGEAVDTDSDRDNCGRCGNECEGDMNCVAGRCTSDGCAPGTTESCYSGSEDTAGTGPCVEGERTCLATGTWGDCEGEVVPTAENCTDNIDNNCNGQVDDNVDQDMDGFTTCGGDCCDSTECSAPIIVNPGSFDASGNGVDDDCDGQIDNTALLCDQGIASNTTNAFDFAKAIDICQMATEQDKKWGVISATLSVSSGSGTPDPVGHAVRPKFGSNLGPIGGVSVAMLSTGAAAGKSDINPPYMPFESYFHVVGAQSTWPVDFKNANGGSLPNAPGCPPPTVTNGIEARDSEMLTVRVRVPTNARSFKLSSTFYSSEFPEYACTRFNDFFVILLDSMYTGTTPNPADKNLAFFQKPGTTEASNRVPVGVNLAHGDTGLFTQCKNGRTGCSGSVTGNITTCTATDQLAGTGFDDIASTGLGPVCDPGQLVGGGTGWLTTTGNVVPGEIITLRIAIWDTSDQRYDSLVVVDGFQWSTELSNPGTVIGRTVQ